MKIRISRYYKQVASTLVTVLVVCALLSMGIGYYMSLVDQQSLLSARSQTWNMAMSVCEAGLEEGLEQINSNASTLTADGWYFDGSLYWRSNNMPDGTQYTVNINMSDPNAPIIVARSYVTISFQAGLFGSMGGTTASTVSKTLTRAIRVKASRGNLFLNALVAKNTIDMNGNGVTTDSYDSGDPSKSTNGHYDSSKYKGDMGDVAANAGVVNALDIGNANIYGHAHVGAGGTVAIGPNGGIGEHSYQAGNSGTAETGWFASDANFTFPDTSFPYAANTAGVLNTAAGGDIVTIAGFSTNSAATNSTTYPNPVPPTGVTTNIISLTVSPWSAVPSPTPAGLVTNSVSTLSTNVWSPGAFFTNTAFWSNVMPYPAPGTYLGAVTTNTSHGVTSGYSFNHITGYSYHYWTYTYPSVTGYSYSVTSTSTIYQTNHYDHILNSGTSYYMNSLTGSTYVAGMDVKLVVANGIDLTLPFVIPQSSAVQVWTGGTSITLSGNDGANQSGVASSFILYCAPSVTSFTLNGNAQFTGVLVAPNANVSLNGGGHSNVDFDGSLMVASVTMNGHFSFHYDESLRHASNQGRYLVTTWDEIP